MGFDKHSQLFLCATSSLLLSPLIMSTLRFLHGICYSPFPNESSPHDAWRFLDNDYEAPSPDFQHLPHLRTNFTSHWPARIFSAFIGQTCRVDPPLSKLGYGIGNPRPRNLLHRGAGGAPIADLKHEEAERERQTEFRNKCLMILEGKDQ